MLLVIIFVILLIFIILDVLLSGLPGSNPFSMHNDHPSLFFCNISECPGYANRYLDPWKSNEYSIIQEAGVALDKNFAWDTWPGDPYDDVMGRASYAKNLALAWQITGNEQYAKKAEEALQNLEKGNPYSSLRKSCAIRDYCIAYDMVQPYMIAATDIKIRDKLAILANQVYNELNNNGTSLNYVTFWDYHGQAYINVAFAGLVLKDYTNPNHININSGPDDWLKCGTDYYFVSDHLHNGHKPIVYYGLDNATGKDLIGYNSYTLQSMVLFAQAYTHVKGENYLDKYPVLKGHFTAEIWDSYPNDVEATYETLMNIRFNYQNCIANLLDEVNRSAVLRHYDNINANIKLMADPSTEGAMNPVTEYLCEYNYNDLARNAPSYTSHLDQNAMFQTMRTGWNTDSDFVSMVTTQQVYTHTARLEARGDQLGIQYYGKGDLMMADGGEDKFVLDKGYGMNAIYHNVVVIENPRTPFNLDENNGGTYRGGLKGDSLGVGEPAFVSRAVTHPWMNILTASERIDRVPDSSWEEPLTLSSTINLERTVLMPDNEYFIVLDRAVSSEPWIYRNIWRPTSFDITKTMDPGSIGHVNGNLFIDGMPYDWQALDYKSEKNTGISTNYFAWNTVNQYGRNVEFRLFSVPSSDVYITKHVSSIGGNGLSSDVYSPIVYFRESAPKKDLYRATVLLSRYIGDPAVEAMPVAVSGNGSAMEIKTADHSDIIYTGNSNSTFASFRTDADTIFIRTVNGQPLEYTMLDGSYIICDNKPLLTLTERADYITLKINDSEITLEVKVDKNVNILVSKLTLPRTLQVMKDGIPFDRWEKSDDNEVTLNSDKGVHTYEIIFKG